MPSACSSVWFQSWVTGSVGFELDHFSVDGGQSGQSLDLRPEIPLRVRW